MNKNIYTFSLKYVSLCKNIIPAITPPTPMQTLYFIAYKCRNP